MKRLATILLFAALTTMVQAQTVEYIDDEECGCELFFFDGIQTTRDGDLHGFRLADGTVIVENKYKYVDQFHGQYCKVYLDEGMCGLIDRTGREIIPCIYSDINYPSSGRILVIKDYRTGYCDMDGRQVIEPQYWQGADFHNGIAVVAVYDSFAPYCLFIDTLGAPLFGTTYENAKPMIEGHALVRRNGLWGIIDSTGREVLPAQYPYMTDNSNGHFFAGYDTGLAMFDYSMQPLTPFVYTWTEGYYEGFTPVYRDGGYGFLDAHGREAIPCIYDQVGAVREGRVMVRRGDHYGIVDTTGRIVLPIEYDNSLPGGTKYTYYDSRALVEKDGKLGFVDLDGKLVIPFYFERAYHFTQGLAAVRHQGLWGYIDTNGDVYLPFVFEFVSPFRWGRAEVVYNGNTSKVDLKGRCVKNCKGIIAWRDIEK